MTGIVIFVERGDPLPNAGHLGRGETLDILDQGWAKVVCEEPHTMPFEVFEDQKYNLYDVLTHNFTSPPTIDTKDSLVCGAIGLYT